MVIGYWLLVIGYWLLVIGYWLLGVGYWLLVIGYWLLVIGSVIFVQYSKVYTVQILIHHYHYHLYGVQRKNTFRLSLHMFRLLWNEGHIGLSLDNWR